MKASDNVIEIEVGAAGRNCNLTFMPLGKRIRGRFDVARAIKTDGEAARLLKAWPDPIPGQVIGIDVEAGMGYLREPLHDPEFAAIRERIEKTGKKLEPERQTFQNRHVPTWLHWLKRAVECGAAKLVRGTLPEKIDGELEFNTPFARAMQTRKDPTTRLAEAMERQSEMLAKVLAELVKSKK